MAGSYKKLLVLLTALLLVLPLGGCGFAGEESVGKEQKTLGFDDMTYRRPDVEKMEQELEQLEQALGRPSLPSTLLRLIRNCYDCYYDFDTMTSLADIRSCQDLTDEFYREEYAWCMENLPRMQQLVDEMYRLCARSFYAPLLERLAFWEGFSQEYGLEPGQQPEEIYELYRQESRLISRYRSIIAEPTVEIDGKSYSYSEYLAAAAGEAEIYRAVEAYYEKYNPLLADVYAQLVKLRREQAQLLGYESYEQMQYSSSYQRDYGPGEAAEYMEDIKENLVPLYRQLMTGQTYSAIQWKFMSEARLENIMAVAAENMGGEIWESFQAMRSRGLYDIQLRANKAQLSFQTYLRNYEAPFLFLSPYGDQSDVLAFAHEFGHFTDAYVNYNAYETTDVAECFSQAMELLVLFYLEGAMTPEEIEQMQVYKALDSLEMYVGQAAIAVFESEVFTLEEGELTAENLNRLYREISTDYCLGDGSLPGWGLSWIDISHLFETPFYVVSYPVTNDAALQIFALEQSCPGLGLDKFREMLPRTQETFMPTLEEGGLLSPFREGSVAAVRQSLEDMLEPLMARAA